jgi:hypothetical protein
MKKYLFLIFISLYSINANAFMFGYMIGSMQSNGNKNRNENSQEIVINNPENIVICDYRISREKCYDPLIHAKFSEQYFISPAQYVGNRGYKHFYKKELKSNGNDWYLIMKAW